MPFFSHCLAPQQNLHKQTEFFTGSHRFFFKIRSKCCQKLTFNNTTCSFNLAKVELKIFQKYYTEDDISGHLILFTPHYMKSQT